MPLTHIMIHTTFEKKHLPGQRKDIYSLLCLGKANELTSNVGCQMLNILVVYKG